MGKKNKKVPALRLEEKGLTGLELKALALFCMTIDHVAYLYYWQIGLPAALILRMIGRFTFPILAFLLTEGFIHTHNRYAYVIRLLCFGLISAVPFYYVFGEPYNVMFTLAAGLILLMLQDMLRKSFPQVNALVWMGAGLLAACATSFLMRDFDWGLPGIIAIYITGQLKRFPYYVQGIAETLVIFLVSVTHSLLKNGTMSGSTLFFYLGIPLAAIWIAMYNGRRGGRASIAVWQKYLFYAYYPFHLLILMLIHH